MSYRQASDRDVDPDFIYCEDCFPREVKVEDLDLVAAEYGEGAFLAVLCKTCDHRRWYRGQLLSRLRRRVG